MRARRFVTVLVPAMAVAIGCGGKPQDASATSDGRLRPDAPMQLAEAPVGAQPAAAAGSASIRGSVKFKGAAPAREKIRMDADPECKKQHAEAVLSEEAVVNDNGTLRNVFVYVKQGASGSFPAPSSPVILDQKGCWYHPRIFGIQVNQPLEIVNSDPSMHNVNAKPSTNQPFNIAQPTQGMKTAKKFAKPEVGVKFKCNVHPWMTAYGHVLEHPFFSLTGAEGSFAITGLPAGSYVVEAWHEKYGTQTQNVTVGDGESATAEFAFTGQ